MGFEPTVLAHTAFRERHLQPLGHLSARENTRAGGTSGSSPQYQSVKELHATFHQAAGDVVALSAARKRTEAMAALEMGSTFKQSSSKLVIALSNWADAAK